MWNDADTSPESDTRITACEYGRLLRLVTDTTPNVASCVVAVIVLVITCFLSWDVAKRNTVDSVA